MKPAAMNADGDGEAVGEKDTEENISDEDETEEGADKTADDAESEEAGEDVDNEKSSPKKKAEIVKMSGSFVASNATEIMRRPKEYPTMRVVTAVEHGERVRRGENARGIGHRKTRFDDRRL